MRESVEFVKAVVGDVGRYVVVVLKELEVERFVSAKSVVVEKLLVVTVDGFESIEILFVVLVNIEVLWSEVEYVSVVDWDMLVMGRVVSTVSFSIRVVLVIVGAMVVED